MRVEIIGQKNGLLIIKPIEQINSNELIKNAICGRVFANLDVQETDSITDQQREHYYALIGDMSYYTGYQIQSWDDMMRYQFMLSEGLDEFPSLARGKMKKSVASKLLEYVITFCIQNDFPFRKQQFYLTTDVSKMNYALTKKRICVACGKPRADLHHASNLIGMGNKRSVHEHEKSTFMSLCRNCHIEIHTIGYSKFCDKYHVKAVKLNRKELKELGVI
ncbi:putative HNHc nuclease [Globicatella sanguinis]